MKQSSLALICAIAAPLLLSACMGQAPVKTSNVQKEPDILTVHEDGTMEFKNRKMNAKDVVIYNDGRGGERAAVKMSLEPLHPPFYRDSIIVIRKTAEES